MKKKKQWRNFEKFMEWVFFLWLYCFIHSLTFPFFHYYVDWLFGRKSSIAKWENWISEKLLVERKESLPLIEFHTNTLVPVFDVCSIAGCQMRWRKVLSYTNSKRTKYRHFKGRHTVVAPICSSTTGHSSECMNNEHSAALCRPPACKRGDCKRVFNLVTLVTIVRQHRCPHLCTAVWNSRMN